MQNRSVYSRLLIKLLIVSVVCVLCILGIPLALDYFAPFILAFLLAWLLNPIVVWVRRKIGVPRKITAIVLVTLLYIIILAVIFWIVYSLVNEVIAFSDNWQSIVTAISATLQNITQGLDTAMSRLPVDLGQQINSWADSISSQLTETLSSLVTWLISALTRFAKSMPSFIIMIIFVIMATYFVSVDYLGIRERFLSRMSASTVQNFNNIKHIVKSAFGGYIRAAFILAVIIMGIIFIGFTIMGMPYAVLLAIIIGFVDFLPYLGAGTVLIPWAAIVLFAGDIRTGIGLLIIYGVIFVVRRIMEPRVIGGQTGLSSFVTLVCIYVGWRMIGLMGMIFGPIVFLIIRNVIRTGIFDSLIQDVKLVYQDIKIRISTPK